MASHIVFYDGDCGFCNRTIRFILDHEQQPHVICFAALQSKYAQDFFSDHGLPAPDMSTFYFWDHGRMYSKSGGALRLLGYLQWPWKLLKAGYIIPAVLRDKLYDFIARRRHRLARGFCVLPSPAERKRFIA